MSEKLVLDAGVLLLHFAGHDEVRSYFDRIISGRCQGLISAYNVAEFHYKACQKLGRQTADTWYFQLRNTELNVVNREELIRAAALEKCRHPDTLPLADCFALALAKAERTLLVTTDGELAKVRDVKTRYIEV